MEHWLEIEFREDTEALTKNIQEEKVTGKMLPANEVSLIDLNRFITNVVYYAYRSLTN